MGNEKSLWLDLGLEKSWRMSYLESITRKPDVTYNH